MAALAMKNREWATAKKFDLKIVPSPAFSNSDESSAYAPNEADMNSFDDGLAWANQILMDHRFLESQRQVQ